MQVDNKFIIYTMSIWKISKVKVESMYIKMASLMKFYIT